MISLSSISKRLMSGLLALMVLASSVQGTVVAGVSLLIPVFAQSSSSAEPVSVNRIDANDLTKEEELVIIRQSNEQKECPDLRVLIKRRLGLDVPDVTLDESDFQAPENNDEARSLLRESLEGRCKRPSPNELPADFAQRQVEFFRDQSLSLGTVDYDHLASFEYDQANNILRITDKSTPPRTFELRLCKNEQGRLVYRSAEGILEYPVDIIPELGATNLRRLNEGIGSIDDERFRYLLRVMPAYELTVEDLKNLMKEIGISDEGINRLLVFNGIVGFTGETDDASRVVFLAKDRVYFVKENERGIREMTHRYFGTGETPPFDIKRVHVRVREWGGQYRARNALLKDEQERARNLEKLERTYRVRKDLYPEGKTTVVVEEGWFTDTEEHMDLRRRFIFQRVNIYEDTITLRDRTNDNQYTFVHEKDGVYVLEMNGKSYKAIVDGTGVPNIESLFNAVFLAVSDQEPRALENDPSYRSWKSREKTVNLGAQFAQLKLLKEAQKEVEDAEEVVRLKLRQMEGFKQDVVNHLGELENPTRLSGRFIAFMSKTADYYSRNKEGNMQAFLKKHKADVEAFINAWLVPQSGEVQSPLEKLVLAYPDKSLKQILLEDMGGDFITAWLSNYGKYDYADIEDETDLLDEEEARFNSLVGNFTENLPDGFTKDVLAVLEVNPQTYITNAVGEGLSEAFLGRRQFVEAEQLIFDIFEGELESIYADKCAENEEDLVKEVTQRIYKMYYQERKARPITDPKTGRVISETSPITLADYLGSRDPLNGGPLRPAEVDKAYENNVKAALAHEKKLCAMKAMLALNRANGLRPFLSGNQEIQDKKLRIFQNFVQTFDKNEEYFTFSKQTQNALYEEIALEVTLVLLTGGIANVAVRGGTLATETGLRFVARKIFGKIAIETAEQGFKAALKARRLYALGLRSTGQLTALGIEGALQEALLRGVKGEDIDGQALTSGALAQIVFNYSGLITERFFTRPKAFQDIFGNTRYARLQTSFGALVNRFAKTELAQGVARELIGTNVEAATLFLFGLAQKAYLNGEVTLDDLIGDAAFQELLGAYRFVIAMKIARKPVAAITPGQKLFLDLERRQANELLSDNQADLQGVAKSLGELKGDLRSAREAGRTEEITSLEAEIADYLQIQQNLIGERHGYKAARAKELNEELEGVQTEIEALVGQEGEDFARRNNPELFAIQRGLNKQLSDLNLERRVLSSDEFSVKIEEARVNFGLDIDVGTLSGRNGFLDPTTGIWYVNGDALKARALEAAAAVDDMSLSEILDGLGAGEIAKIFSAETIENTPLLKAVVDLRAAETAVSEAEVNAGLLEAKYQEVDADPQSSADAVLFAMVSARLARQSADNAVATRDAARDRYAAELENGTGAAVDQTIANYYKKYRYREVYRDHSRHEWGHRAALSLGGGRNFLFASLGFTDEADPLQIEKFHELLADYFGETVLAVELRGNLPPDLLARFEAFVLLVRSQNPDLPLGEVENRAAQRFLNSLLDPLVTEVLRGELEAQGGQLTDGEVDALARMRVNKGLDAAREVSDSSDVVVLEDVRRALPAEMQSIFDAERARIEFEHPNASEAEVGRLVLEALLTGQMTPVFLLGVREGISASEGFSGEDISTILAARLGRMKSIKNMRERFMRGFVAENIPLLFQFNVNNSPALRVLQRRSVGFTSPEFKRLAIAEGVLFQALLQRGLVTPDGEITFDIFDLEPSQIVGLRAIVSSVIKIRYELREQAKARNVVIDSNLPTGAKGFDALLDYFDNRANRQREALDAAKALELNRLDARRGDLPSQSFNEARTAIETKYADYFRLFLEGKGADVDVYVNEGGQSVTRRFFVTFGDATFIASGTYGNTFKGYYVDNNGEIKEMAVKQFKEPQADDPKFEMDWADKLAADQANGIESDNVIKVLGKGGDPNRPIVAYNLVKSFSGKPQQLSDYQFSSPEEAMFFFQKLTATVLELNQRGIIINDLKPANIMVNENGEPVIIDVGSWHLKGQEADYPVGSLEARLTHEGSFMGREGTSVVCTKSYGGFIIPVVNSFKKSTGLEIDIVALGRTLNRLLNGAFSSNFGSVIAQNPEFRSALQQIASDFQSVENYYSDSMFGVDSFVVIDVINQLRAGDRLALIDLMRDGGLTDNNFLDRLEPIRTEARRRLNEALNDLVDLADALPPELETRLDDAAEDRVINYVELEIELYRLLEDDAPGILSGENPAVLDSLPENVRAEAEAIAREIILLRENDLSTGLGTLEGLIDSVRKQRKRLERTDSDAIEPLDLGVLESAQGRINVDGEALVFELGSDVVSVVISQERGVVIVRQGDEVREYAPGEDIVLIADDGASILIKTRGDGRILVTNNGEVNLQIRSRLEARRGAAERVNVNKEAYGTLTRDTKVTAIPDVHGDVEALRRSLRNQGLIDANDTWIGGNRRLVMMGDLIDRGQSNLEVLDLLARIIPEAQREGGNVEILFGNHEVMMLETLLIPGESTNWLVNGGRRVINEVIQKYGLESNDYNGAIAKLRELILDPAGPYHFLVTDLKVVNQVDDVLYVHGGVSPEFARELALKGIDEVNREFRSAIDTFRKYSGRDPDSLNRSELAEADRAAEIFERFNAVGQSRSRSAKAPRFGGPFWMDFSRGVEKVSEADVKITVAKLKELGINAVVVGHTPVDTPRFAPNFLNEGLLFLSLDLKISSGYNTRDGSAGLTIDEGAGGRMVIDNKGQTFTPQIPRGIGPSDAVATFEAVDPGKSIKTVFQEGDIIEVQLADGIVLEWRYIDTYNIDVYLNGEYKEGYFFDDPRLLEGVVIGRVENVGLQIVDAAVSRSHAKVSIEMVDGELRLVVADDFSKNGTQVRLRKASVVKEAPVEKPRFGELNAEDADLLPQMVASDMSYSPIDGTRFRSQADRDAYVRKLENFSDLSELEKLWYKLKPPSPSLPTRGSKYLFNTSLEGASVRNRLNAVKAFNAQFVSEYVIPDLISRGASFDVIIKELHYWASRGTDAHLNFLQNNTGDFLGQIRDGDVFIGNLAPPPSEGGFLDYAFGRLTSQIDTTVRDLKARKASLSEEAYVDASLRLGYAALQLFVDVHPFADGNGRTSRALFELIITDLLGPDFELVRLPLGERSPGQEAGAQTTDDRIQDFQQEYQVDFYNPDKLSELGVVTRLYLSGDSVEGSRYYEIFEDLMSRITLDDVLPGGERYPYQDAVDYIKGLLPSQNTTLLPPGETNSRLYFGERQEIVVTVNNQEYRARIVDEGVEVTFGGVNVVKKALNKTIRLRFGDAGKVGFKVRPSTSKPGQYRLAIANDLEGVDVSVRISTIPRTSSLIRSLVWLTPVDRLELEALYNKVSSERSMSSVSNNVFASLFQVYGSNKHELFENNKNLAEKIVLQGFAYGNSVVQRFVADVFSPL